MTVTENSINIEKYKEKITYNFNIQITTQYFLILDILIFVYVYTLYKYML